MAARNPNQEQFELYRDWQWCKHLVLKKYSMPWSRILGSIADRIYVVDLCAGAGTYVDPTTDETLSDGSPVIFARRAKEYTESHGPRKSMHVICVERDPENYAKLVDAVAPYEPHVTTMHGSLRQHVPAITERIGDAPALILLDPIGLKTITAASWRPLLERRGKTDIFVVLMFPGLHRIAGMLGDDGQPKPAVAGAAKAAQGMDDVFLTKRWREISKAPELQDAKRREERERRLVDLWCEHVVGRRHTKMAYYRVRARYADPVKYWLVQLSNDPKPYMLMNDQIVELDEKLVEQEYCGHGELEGFTDNMLEAHRATVLAELQQATIEILEHAIGHALPFCAIRDQLTPRFFGRVKQGAYSNVVKALSWDGYPLRRDLPEGARKDAKIDDNEIITLVSPPRAPGSGAEVVPIRRAA